MASSIRRSDAPIDGPTSTAGGWLVAVGEAGRQYLIFRRDYGDAVRLRAALDEVVRHAKAEAFVEVVGTIRKKAGRYADLATDLNAPESAWDSDLEAAAAALHELADELDARVAALGLVAGA